MRRLLNLVSLVRENYTTTYYERGLTGTSDCNEFIPVYAISCHKLLVFKEVDARVMEYTMPTTNIPRYSRFRNYAYLISHLKGGTTPMIYNFKVAGQDCNVNVDRGIIYDNEGDILMCLAINKDYLFNTSKEALTTDPEIPQFVVFISNLLEDPRYKNLKKKLNELYLDIAKQMGLDVVYTSRIKEWLFKNNVKPLKFKSIAQLNKHLKEEIPPKILEM